MRFIRSTTCSLKFATQNKKQELAKILSEYSKVVNQYILYFWRDNVDARKINLFKKIVDLPDTWLSARLRKVAAREALDMVASVRNKKGEVGGMPKHYGKSMSVSCTIAELKDAHTAKGFDSWLHLASVGDKMILDLPIKKHKQFHKWNRLGKRLNSYIIRPDSVQFCFEIETDKKKQKGKIIGVDTGINALASISDGRQYGQDIKEIIETIKRKKHGSKAQKRVRRSLRQRMDEVAKEIVVGAKLVVVESLNKMNHKTKLKRRLSKNIRRSLGAWNYRYWLDKLEMTCEVNRVSFRSVPAYYTSQRCFKCGHTERNNRHGEVFLCLQCGHRDNADINAAKNIEWRFMSGPYGAAFEKPKPKEIVESHNS